jgi:tRNA (guanine-N7-)-methyltransferase
VKHPVPTVDHRDIILERRRLLRETCAALLDRQPAFVWEIGSGHGHFLTGYAAQHRDRLCIGIDVILERIDRSNRKRERANLTNLHFIRADAADFLAALPANAVATEIYILFPDPWPKRRHWKNRLIEPAFLQAAAQRAGLGARLYFRTDFEPYYRQASAWFAGQSEWRIQPEAPWPFELETVFQRRAARYHSLIAERI